MSTSEAHFSADHRALFLKAEAAPLTTAVQLLGSLAGQFWRAGQLPEFAECFRRLYILQPPATLAKLLGSVPVPAIRLRDLARALVRQGIGYATVVAELALAEAALGNTAAVRELIDYGFFHHRVGDASGDGDFHAALAAEVHSKMEFYGERAGRAIQHAWRHNDVLNASTPALTTLRDELSVHVARYVAALPRANHPFLRTVPADLTLNGWAVVSGAASHHKPHIHPRAWLTGVYYVEQPDASRDAAGRIGWLRVGAPPHAGTDAVERGWETRWVEPRPGTLVLMPAYFYHGTQPMGRQQGRICIAFEVCHRELVPPAPRCDDEGIS